MREQAAAYRRLETAAAQLSAALVRGAADSIESLTRAGEGELLRMRSRLLQITAGLTAFAEARAQNAEKPGASLSASARGEFETAAAELLAAARAFERVSARAAVLARGGSSFATACIQVCGVTPQTYRAPATRGYTENAR
jgi:hypothetical protein